MNLSGRKALTCIITFFIIPLFLIGCINNSNNDKENNGIKKISVGKGAVLKSEEGVYNTYDYKQGKYTKVESEKTILVYDESSSTYIATNNNKTYVVKTNEEYEIQDEEYDGLKMSPKGKYISYFVYDDGFKPKIIDLEENKELDIKLNTIISGTIYDWYDEENIIYYGVNRDKVNGVFKYNLITKKEELLYKVEKGYLAYIKGTINNVVFLAINIDNDKELILINKDTKKISSISYDIEIIDDIAFIDGNIYFTGKVKDNAESLYEIEDNKIKRLIFDFPFITDINKGLRVDKDNNILVIGKGSSDSQYESVYSYAKDGSVSVVSEEAIDYVFIDYRENEDY